jgi:hypothetical protein
MDGSFWNSASTVLAVMTPLVAVPLTVITFYLRSLREHQMTWHGELVRRFEALERSTAQLRATVTQFERDYTTKEEWLRECMMARQTLEGLSKAAVRLETSMDNIVSNVQPFLIASARLLKEGDGQSSFEESGSGGKK